MFSWRFNWMIPTKTPKNLQILHTCHPFLQNAEALKSQGWTAKEAEKSTQQTYLGGVLHPSKLSVTTRTQDQLSLFYLCLFEGDSNINLLLLTVTGEGVRIPKTYPTISYKKSFLWFFQVSYFCRGDFCSENVWKDDTIWWKKYCIRWTKPRKLRMDTSHDGLWKMYLRLQRWRHFQYLLPRKLTCPLKNSKIVVGRLLSFWNGPFLGDIRSFFGDVWLHFQYLFVKFGGFIAPLGGESDQQYGDTKGNHQTRFAKLLYWFPCFSSVYRW